MAETASVEFSAGTRISFIDTIVLGCYTHPASSPINMGISGIKWLVRGTVYLTFACCCVLMMYCVDKNAIFTNLIVQGGFEGSETLSLGSLESRSRSSSERRHEARGGSRWNNINTGATHRTGSILRHVILKGISTQLTSASVSMSHFHMLFIYLFSSYVDKSTSQH